MSTLFNLRLSKCDVTRSTTHTLLFVISVPKTKTTRILDHPLLSVFLSNVFINAHWVEPSLVPYERTFDFSFFCFLLPSPPLSFLLLKKKDPSPLPCVSRILILWVNTQVLIGLNIPRRTPRVWTRKTEVLSTREVTFYYTRNHEVKISPTRCFPWFKGHHCESQRVWSTSLLSAFPRTIFFIYQGSRVGMTL